MIIWERKSSEATAAFPPHKEHFLDEGDIVSLDAGVIYKGYHSDAARTYGIGQIDDDAKKLIGQNFRRPDTYKTDFTAGRSVSALLLQQYKSGLYFQFCSLENTGKKRTDDSVHPDPDSCAHSGQLFYEKNVFEGKTGISGSGFRLAEKYVLVL